MSRRRDKMPAVKIVTELRDNNKIRREYTALTGVPIVSETTVYDKQS